MVAYAIHFSSGGAYVAAAAALVGFVVLLTVVGGGHVQSLVIGQDGRTSTSKVQALLWTFAVAFAVLALMFQGQTDINIVPDYLYLLGFPALALLFAKGITQQKIVNGDIVKVAPTSTAAPAVAAANQVAPAAGQPAAAGAGAAPRRTWRDWLGDVINNDAGEPDIADFQYVLFNLITLTYFFLHFFGTPDTLPHIPPTLLALTGASAGTYVGNKLVLNQSPVLVGATPPSGAAGVQVTLRGSNLGSAGTATDGAPVVTTVKFDGVAQAPLSVTDLALVVAAPAVSFDAGARSKTIQVSVVNAAGIESNQIPFTVVAPA